MAYDLPVDLSGEIDYLDQLIKKFKSGEISAAELKAHRVPFGVYEQRKADTYMVRIRCAAGQITPIQLQQVAVVASEHAEGDLHITTRQELQIHYVALENIVPVMRELQKIGLSTRGGGGNTVRNIVTQEDAGIDPAEEFDVSGYANALTSRLIAESDSWNLPRKFKIAFSGSAEDKGFATITDIGFIACKKDGKNGFRVYAAGGLGAKSAVGNLLLDFIEVDQVYPVAKALKNVFFKYGNRKNKHAARMRFLWQSLGKEEFNKKFDQEYAEVKQVGFLPLQVAEGYQKNSIIAVSEEPKALDEFDLWRKRFVKPQKQPGLFSVLIPVELGFISCEKAMQSARFLGLFGNDVLRLTRDQNLFLRNIPEQFLGNIYNFLSRNFIESKEAAIYGRILSCAGASTCQLGICLSRQAAKALMAELRKEKVDLDTLGEVRFNISGCPNSCGLHALADLGFTGKALRKDGRLYPAYTVFAGAVIHDGQTRLAEAVGDVAAKYLPVLVKDIFNTFLAKQEKYKTFRQYMASVGKDDLRNLCLRYQDIPSFKQDEGSYFDWGTEVPFSLAERKAGECSAGFFDLLEMDLNNIKKVQAALDAHGLDHTGKKKLLGELVLFSSRALLITRGVDVKSHDEAFIEFIRHFIEAGLIDRSFREIVLTVKRGDLELVQEDEARGLAKAVQALYETMDNTFNFNLPAQASIEKKEIPALVKDLRGVACPLNFVKTKVELSKLKPGEILEVWLDDGPPIDNVPGSVQAEGHKILSQKRIGTYWSVTIEKFSTS